MNIVLTLTYQKSQLEDFNKVGKSQNLAGTLKYKMLR